MKGKPVNTALFGTVQASARIFIARALTTWRIAESSGETAKLATDFDAWLRAIVTDQLPEVRKKLGVEVKIPRH